MAEAADERLPEGCEEDLASLGSMATAAIELHDARQLHADTLDLARLERPFDFEFLRQCSEREGSFAIPTVSHEHVQPVARAYEEEFLNEPEGPHQRYCRFGENCEGLKLEVEGGFTLREYLLPGQSPCDERRPCLLCTRMLISMGFYNLLAESVPSSERSGFALSPYYNLVDIPGEYCLADCLASPGLSAHFCALPVIKHMRSAYAVRRESGGRRVVQSLYARPGDAEAPAFFRRGALQSTRAK